MLGLELWGDSNFDMETKPSEGRRVYYVFGIRRYLKNKG